MKLWKWLKSKCKCTKRCKCWHCRLARWAEKTASGISNWIKDNITLELLKGLGLIAAALWLWFTGSLECTVGFLLLGWGLIELSEWYRWK